MSMPPTLPGVQPGLPRSRFVSVLAWVTLATAGMSVLAGLVQAVAGWLLPADHGLRMLTGGLGPVPQLPPLFHWYYTHGLLAGLATVLVSGLMGLAGWGLLQRRAWGRQAFIAMLLLGTAGQLASLALLPQMVEVALAVQEATLSVQGLPPSELPPGFVHMLQVLMLIPATMIVVLAGFHLWLVWRLGRADVRAEFPG